LEKEKMKKINNMKKILIFVINYKKNFTMKKNYIYENCFNFQNICPFEFNDFEKTKIHKINEENKKQKEEEK
jgi:hypothetical protein